MPHKAIHPLFLGLCFLLLVTVVATGCAAPGASVTAEPTAEMEMESEHEDEEDHAEGEDHEHEDVVRIPNDGAVIRIVSPAEGSVFAAADEVLVEVEVENFDLEAEGNHWHVYVDGSTWGMIPADVPTYALRGLDPGEHEISVYLAIGTHEELEEGDAIHITVE